MWYFSFEEKREGEEEEEEVELLSILSGDAWAPDGLEGFQAPRLVGSNNSISSAWPPDPLRGHVTPAWFRE